MGPSPKYEFPGGKRFAFSLFDDTDVATVENVGPVYELLDRLGLRVTKSAWPLACPEGSRLFGSSQTLEDADYRAFVLDLHRSGFEIGWHCATMESSRRERTVHGLERFAELFGEYPRTHVNHAVNRENLYWGADRLDAPLLRSLYGRLDGAEAGHYLGHVEGSDYWWGDLCREHIDYVRNLTFHDLNLAKVNPSMPYRDPRRPHVRFWFSATDAEAGEDFVRMFTPRRLDRLEREGGFCILATHLAKRYTVDGKVRSDVRERFEDLAGREGWFPTVAELLDWLRERRTDDSLPASEWRRMQWRWARDLFWRGRRKRKRRKRRRRAGAR